ncbi:MAG: AprI/Inh family metalloprotease inhibitor [Bauldia litoralis]
MIAEPLPPAAGGIATPVAAAPPAAPVASGTVGRTDLLGGWTIASSGESCQLFMTLTSWTGGYRASTRGCSSDMLKSISAWNLQGSQVVLAGQGGTPIARLQSSGGSRFDGSAEGGGAVSFYR